jgi:predicted O-methyltransferase YrrM
VTDSPHHTVLPILLVGPSSAEAVARFGARGAPTRLASYDDVLSGSQDEYIRESTVVGVAAGAAAIASAKYVLNLVGQGNHPVEILLEMGADERLDLRALAKDFDLQPVDSLSVERAGFGVCLRMHVIPAGASTGGPPVEVDGLFHTQEDEPQTFENFVAGAAVVRLEERVERLRAEKEALRERAKGLHVKLKETRARLSAVQSERAELVASEWVHVGMAVGRAAGRIAQRLHIPVRLLLLSMVFLLFLLVVGPVLVLAAAGVALSPVAVLVAAVLAELCAIIGLSLVIAVQGRRAERLTSLLNHRLETIDHKVNGQYADLRKRLMPQMKEIQSSARGLAGDLAALAAQHEEASARHLAASQDGVASLKREIVQIPRTLRQAEIPQWFRQFEQRDIRRTAVERRQVQAMMNLFALSPVRAGIPPMGGWAASPDVLLLMVNELIVQRPQTVLEFGSGLSTLWFALVAREYELETRVLALEHDARFADATEELLRQHGVGDRAEVRLAPLVPHAERTAWYDKDALADVSEVGLVFVDGPPADTGPLARMPAVPELLGRLAPKCTIVLDDLVRQEEKDIAAAWRELLPDFRYEEVMAEKGAAVFRRRLDG